MRFIDVHCHLDYKTYGEIDSLMERIRAKGVEKVITIGFDLNSSRVAKEISERFDFCYFTAGFHPTELREYKEGDLEEIEDLARHPKCVAIGEIGLDYHYPDTNKELEMEMFIRQLHLADRLSMPVQIHSRDSAEDMLKVITEHKNLLSNGGVLHCYSHSKEMALEFEKRGMYFSFGGTSTYTGSKKARRTIEALSDDRLLTETDSPYLPPKSIYGTFPNTPESIPEICQNMAQIRNESVEAMSEKVWENAHRLFPKLR